MTCYLWIESLPEESIAQFVHYLESEPWEEDFPFRFLKHTLTQDFVAIGKYDDYPMFLSDFDRVERFFTELAKRVPCLKLYAYGFCDLGDPKIAPNAPPDFGGIFTIELFGDGSADCDLTPF